MGAWRELYFSEGTFKPDATKTAAWNRGAYLVEGLGHCSDCHSPRNLLGGIEKSKDFTGAVIDGWFALDLTSDIATGLGSWTGRADRDLSQDRRPPSRRPRRWARWPK
jgi:mono/diheme cytochrome c family protein